MIITESIQAGQETFFSDNLEEGLSLLSVKYKPVLRLLQHPVTGEIRVPKTPCKLLNLVRHLVSTKQLPGTSIHTQSSWFKTQIVNGIRVKKGLRKSEDILIMWPGGDLRIRYSGNTAKGLFFFFYKEA